MMMLRRWWVVCPWLLLLNRRIPGLLLVLRRGLLLLLVESQLPQEIVPLHFPSVAEVTALLLKLSNGILKGSVETDALLEILLHLLVHVIGVLDLGGKRRAGSLPLPDVEKRHELGML